MQRQSWRGPSIDEQDLLTVRIAEFHAESVTSADAALSRLLALPEVKRKMADKNEKRGLACHIAILRQLSAISRIESHSEQIPLSIERYANALRKRVRVEIIG